MDSDDAAIRRTGYFVFGTCACLYAAIGLTGYSAYHWLRYGLWEPLMLSSMIGPPRVTWLGIQQYIDRLWSVPLYALLFMTALLVIFLYGRLGGSPA